MKAIKTKKPGSSSLSYQLIQLTGVCGTLRISQYQDRLQICVNGTIEEDNAESCKKFCYGSELYTVESLNYDEPSSRDQVMVRKIIFASDNLWTFLNEESQTKLMTFAQEFYNVLPITMPRKSSFEEYQTQLFGFKLGRDFRDDYNTGDGIKYLQNKFPKYFKLEDTMSK